MNKEFIPYEEALELQWLGFDCTPYAWWTNNGREQFITFNNDYTNLIAPLFQQAFRWFREKYGLMGIVDCFLYPFSYTYNINDSVNEKIILWSEPENDFETYEEAEKALLIKLIELVKQN